MPDVFIPIDTSGVTPYFNKLIQKGVIYKFAFRYTDENRKLLTSFKDLSELENYFGQQNLLKQFVDMASEMGIKPSGNQLKISADLIKTQIKAYIARNVFDNAGFYPIIQQEDTNLKEALRIIELNQKQYNEYLYHETVN